MVILFLALKYLHGWQDGLYHHHSAMSEGMGGENTEENKL